MMPSHIFFAFCNSFILSYDTFPSRASRSNSSNVMLYLVPSTNVMHAYITFPFSWSHVGIISFICLFNRSDFVATFISIIFSPLQLRTKWCRGRPYPEVTVAFLPSSLGINHSFALVFSTGLPVLVCGTGSLYLCLEAFLGSLLHQISFGEPPDFHIP